MEGLALYNYQVVVGPECRATRASSIVETLW
jgi:hypothetical protein